MSQEPVVIGQIEQPTTLGEGAAGGPHSSGQLVKLTGAAATKEEQSLSAIVGTEGVTTVDGWAKWAKVGRRQRTAMTVFEGYEPYAISVPILLDARFLGHSDIEHQVAILEWMGGRGTLFRGHPYAEGEGEPPLIEISSDSELVPKWCQSRGHGNGTLSVLEHIEYNMLGREWVPPIRRNINSHGAGRRTRQAATLTLLEYVGAPDARSNAIVHDVNLLRAQEHTYETWTVHDGVNTFTRIAKYYNRRDHRRISEAAREIQKANPKLGASVTKTLPHGAKVRVPLSATDKRA